MTPRGPGGRPKNAWNNSRRRILVRLYTLTNLDKEEIRRLLKAHEFDPSSSDIQKKLRVLLPLDYATDFRNFRPRNDSNMKLRFEAIRKCRKGRILKHRKAKGRGRRAPDPAKSSTSPRLVGPFFHSFEGPTTAFLNHQESLPTITPLELSSNLRDSTPVNSSLLLLDGSSLSTSSFLPARSDNSRNLGPSMTVGATTLKRNNALRQPSGQRHRAAVEIPHTCRTRHTDLPTLKRLLGDKYSDSYLRHVQSVFRYSSTNSERSSLISFPSSSSSTGSQRSAQSPRQPATSSTSALLDARESLSSSTISRYSSVGVRLNVCEEGLVSYRDPSFPLMGSLTIEEQQIWNELVDDDQFELAHGPRPQDSAVSPLNRKCCLPLSPDAIEENANSSSCRKCGLSPAHRRALRLGIRSWNVGSFVDDSKFYSDAKNYKKIDFYGNTLLHCVAAAIGPDDLWIIRRLITISPKVTIEQLNTSGQTFVHLLCRKGLRTTKAICAFVEILKDLTLINFPLLKQDYHGRSILHTLFYSSQDYMYTLDILRDLFAIIPPDLNDNYGLTALDYLKSFAQGLEYHENWSTYQKMLQSLSDNFPGRVFREVETNSYVKSFEGMTNEDKAHIWILRLEKAKCIAWIDSFGYTPLSALIEYWNPDEKPALEEPVKQMLKLGAEIHTRDKNGDTPLAIATKRGFRPVVTLLLKHGANVHCRGYNGRGILSEAEEQMNAAKLAGDDKLYAGICSCYVALVDAGARSHSSQRAEWRLPSAQKQMKRDTSHLKYKLIPGGFI